jgi:hypothetical protein
VRMARRSAQIRRIMSTLGNGLSASLPGLTLQVGFTQLAALNTAELRQAEFRCNPSASPDRFFRWMPGSSPIGAKISACPGRCAAWSIKGVYARLRGLWRNDALQTRDRYTHRLRDGPGPAVHRFAIARAAPHPGHVTP